MSEHTKCERDRAELIKALDEILDFAEEREDIKDGAFGPLPNDWMRIAETVRAAKAKVTP